VIRRHVWNLVLGVFLLLSFGFNWYARQPTPDPNVEYMPDMARGPGYESYEPNTNFANGSTMQAPPPGTIPRGVPPFEFGPNFSEAQRAGNELPNPFSMEDAAALERGGVVFERYCALCHGADGTGGGSIIEHGFRRPPTLLRAFTRRMKDGQLFHLVTYGRGVMPSHAAQIAVDDRWKAVLHVRRLQQEDAGAKPAGGE
jgi:mono/diheme cytochrome c family protein